MAELASGSVGAKFDLDNHLASTRRKRISLGFGFGAGCLLRARQLRRTQLQDAESAEKRRRRSVGVSSSRPPLGSARRPITSITAAMCARPARQSGCRSAAGAASHAPLAAAAPCHCANRARQNNRPHRWARADLTLDSAPQLRRAKFSRIIGRTQDTGSERVGRSSRRESEHWLRSASEAALLSAL